jgi:hypothetical protein
MGSHDSFLDVKTVIAVIASIIGLLSLVMALGRTPPEDARTNLLRWVEFVGIHRIPEWVKTRRADVAFRRFTTIASVISVAIAAGAAVANYIEHLDDGIGRFKIGATPVSGPPTTAGNETLKWLDVSGDLRLTDVDRWKYAMALHTQTSNPGGGKHCEARLWSKPGDKTSDSVAQEVQPIMRLGSWQIAGGSNIKTVFPDGITINVAQESGPTFNCGYRLSEWFENMSIKPVHFRANITTPDLVDCKDCVEVVFGSINRPE